MELHKSIDVIAWNQKSVENLTQYNTLNISNATHGKAD
jgi:hypothetical protein